MELLVKINKKLEQRRAILNTIIQNVGIQNKIPKIRNYHPIHD